VAPASGTALGGVLAGFMVPLPAGAAHLVYFVLRRFFRARWSASPHAGIDAATRGAIVVASTQSASPAASVSRSWLWPCARRSLGARGVLRSLAPSLVRSSFGLDSSLVGGIALFVLAGSAGIPVLLTRARGAYAEDLWRDSPPRRVALVVNSPLTIGTAFSSDSACGSGFGTGFQGAHQDRASTRRAAGAAACCQ